MSRDAIRKQILSSELGRELVDVPEWGVKVEVRDRTVGEQFDLIDSVRRADGSLDMRLLSVEAVIACTYDPESGERIFDAADRDMLLTKSSQAFTRLMAAANRAAGLEDEETVTASLEPTGGGSSS